MAHWLTVETQLIVIQKCDFELTNRKYGPMEAAFQKFHVISITS